MNIEAIFTCGGGYDGEKEMARKKLVIGQSYNVVYSDVGRSCTYIGLEGVDGHFNSCLFDVDFGLLCDMAKRQQYSYDDR